jgi:hypothetical protein
MVQIQSKQERSMWVSALINSIPDIAIAWIASDVFAIGPIGFVAVFVGMQCLYLFLGLKMILWSWLVFWISAVHAGGFFFTPVKDGRPLCR